MNQPIRLRPSNQLLASKIVMTALLPGKAEIDGSVSDDVMKFYKSISGVDTVILGHFCSEKEFSCAESPLLLIDNQKHKKALRKLRKELGDCKALIQINYATSGDKLTFLEISKICSQIKVMSDIVYECDFDGISLNFAYNFLLSHLLAMIENDESLLYTFIDLLADLRATHLDKILSIKITLNTVKEYQNFLKYFTKFDEYVDFFEISSGVLNHFVALDFDPAKNAIKFISEKEFLPDKIMITGGFRTREQIEEALESCGLVGIGRPFIYEKNVKEKLIEGKKLISGPTYGKLCSSIIHKEIKAERVQKLISEIEFEAAQENITNRILGKKMNLTPHILPMYDRE